MRYAAVVLIVVLLMGSAARATEAPRNVLLIIGDDQGLDGACFGNPAVDTPAMDQLAQLGTRFSNAFATVSSCSPSRAVILTGLYTHTNGQYGLAHASNNQWTLASVRSLPGILNDAGYRTALIGKNHVQPKEVYPYQQEILKTAETRDVVKVSEQAKQIFTADDKRPFFLVIGFHDPHRAVQGFANERRSKYDPANVKVPAFLPDNPQVRKDIADYYQAVNRLDRGIGLVMEELTRAGKRDDTLVIYVSDNGMPFPGAKTTVYDAGIKLPLIVRVPGKKAAVVSQAMVSYIDLAPTVLDWCGVKAPKDLPGRSLISIMEDEKPSGWDEVYASYVMHEVWMYYPMRAVRTRQYKLIWNLAHELEYPVASDIARSPSWKACLKTKQMGGRTLEQYLHRPEFELYDVQNDPDEMKNLAADSEHAKVKDQLLEKIRQMMEKTNDPWNVLLKQKEQTR